MLSCNIEMMNQVMSGFHSLWQCKQVEDTIEVCTPLVTATRKFVTLYVGIRNGNYIISDGGDICDGSYDNNVAAVTDFDFSELVFYKQYHKVLETRDVNQSPIYYKKTQNPAMVGTLVYEMAHFVQSVVNASSQFLMPGANEDKQRVLFTSKANSFLKEVFGKSVAFNRQFGGASFNAVITAKRSRLACCKFITGASPGYFKDSVAKAYMDYDLLAKAPEGDYVDNKIALIDDSAGGYNANRFFEALSLMEEKDTKNIRWSEKDKLLQYL